jgi:hypothetical protein
MPGQVGRHPGADAESHRDDTIGCMRLLEAVEDQDRVRQQSRRARPPVLGA